MSKLFACLSVALFMVGLTLPAYAFAQIELPTLISDGAVLQRDHKIPIRGKAPANTTVSVTLGKLSRSADSDKDGNWRVEFPARSAGGPLTLTVSAGAHSNTVQDLYIGDVWVASGQSNMEWVLRNARSGKMEMMAADLPQIRHFKVPLTWSAAPEAELAGGQWQAATKAHKGEFSAVAYFFAKKVYNETEIPIGLIGSNWGGSNVQAWMSPAALGKPPLQTQAAIEQLGAESKRETKALRQILQRWPGALLEDMSPALLERARSDWSAAKLDTENWLVLEAPALWEAQGFPGMDGVVWYRKTFTLSEAEAAEPLVLSLGRIDDQDTTWVNGHKVGNTDAYNLRRQYTVPKDYLKAGTNSIAVRVKDTSGGGGIYSSPDFLYLETAGGERRSLAGSWKIKADKVALSPIGNMNHVDAALYNKMLHPLFDFPVKGVLWYQGESNADTVDEAKRYTQQFQALIKDWRRGWQQPEMPFYWVQLANFESGRNSDAGKPWAILREAQSAALALPNTGQAITIDVGDADDIHPRDKKTVGERLALIALSQTYGRDEVRYRGPVFSKVEAKNRQLAVTFDCDTPLAVRGSKTSVHGFEVITADGVTKPVQGKLKGLSVVIDIENPDKVTGIRYAWDDNPENANLINIAGLPAEPFQASVK